MEYRAVASSPSRRARYVTDVPSGVQASDPTLTSPPMYSRDVPAPTSKTCNRLQAVPSASSGGSRGTPTRYATCRPSGDTTALDTVRIRATSCGVRPPSAVWPGRRVAVRADSRTAPANPTYILSQPAIHHRTIPVRSQYIRVRASLQQVPFRCDLRTVNPPGSCSPLPMHPGSTSGARQTRRPPTPPRTRGARLARACRRRCHRPHPTAHGSRRGARS